MRRRNLLLAIVAIASLTLAFQPPVNRYFEIVKNLEIFTNIYKELNSGYVDDLDPARTMRHGIDAMLGALDPYTNYISESEIEGYRTLAEGKYKGIGAQVKKIGEYVTILQVYENSPALKAGLKAGDRIVQVDGQDARDRSTEDLNQIMQGVPGTKIRLQIARPGQDKPFPLELTREEVDIPNVPYSGKVDDHIGYVSLTTFTQQAGANIAQAIQDLKAADPQLQGLVLDLRDNGGGLLNEAVNICNLFLPKNELVVTTKGKTPDQERSYRTQSAPLDLEIPVVVLVNKRSASASEIVSGTLQDLDRAVVMGQLTYGKGLVQHTKEIGYNARLKLTTAKYYIPSGRCIQAVRYKQGEPEHIPDAERARFKTRNGRLVLDGGGVKPDIPLDTLHESALVRALREQDLIFEFVTTYTLNRDSVAPPDEFRFEEWSRFTEFLRQRKFSFKTFTETSLQTVKADLERDGVGPDMKSRLAAVEAELEKFRQTRLDAEKDHITRLIELEIIGRYYHEMGRKKIGLRNDPEINAAVSLLKDQPRYRSILKGKG